MIFGTLSPVSITFSMIFGTLFSVLSSDFFAGEITVFSGSSTFGSGCSIRSGSCSPLSGSSLSTLLSLCGSAASSSTSLSGSLSVLSCSASVTSSIVSSSGSPPKASRIRSKNSRYSILCGVCPYFLYFRQSSWNIRKNSPLR